MGDQKTQTILEQLFEQFVAPTLTMMAKEKWVHLTPIKDFAIVEAGLTERVDIPLRHLARPESKLFGILHKCQFPTAKRCRWITRLNCLADRIGFRRVCH